MDIKNHKYDYGVYTVHVYVTVENDVCKLAGQAEATIEQLCIEVKVQASEDEKVYNIISGIYYVGVYAQRRDGANTCLVMTAFRHDESASVQEIEVRNLNASAGTFDIFVKGVSASCGVDSVQIPVWSKENQSDIMWYTAWRQNDGSYATQVNLKNHNYNYAEYTAHVYVTSKTQVKTYAGATSVVVNKPQISVKTVLSADETRCNLIASNVGAALGIEKVYFAVWSEQGGQDDLYWYPAERVYSGTWKREISIATHKTPGIYQVHLYGEDGNGVRYILGTKTFSVSNVAVQSIIVKNLNAGNGTFDVYIYGIISPSGVETVQIPVWSKNDQSDLIWYTAWKQGDGSYATQVNIRNHNNKHGKYIIHTYVTAGNKVHMFTGATETKM